MGLGSLGMSELVVIFVIVLVFFGPRRFPEIARSMGSAMREFRRSLNQIQRELEEVDPRKDIPGKDILDEFRKGKPGNWLDPNRTTSPNRPTSASRATPGARSAPEATEPQVTGEAVAPGPAEPVATSTVAASPGGDGGEQLPMFDASPSDPPAPDAEPPKEPDSVDGPEPPTVGSRSD
jgi:sec-independent protein translocase protein TatA